LRQGQRVAVTPLGAPVITPRVMAVSPEPRPRNHGPGWSTPGWSTPCGSAVAPVGISRGSAATPAATPAVIGSAATPGVIGSAVTSATTTSAITATPVIHARGSAKTDATCATPNALSSTPLAQVSTASAAGDELFDVERDDRELESHRQGGSEIVEDPLQDSSPDGDGVDGSARLIDPDQHRRPPAEIQEVLEDVASQENIEPPEMDRPSLETEDGVCLTYESIPAPSQSDAGYAKTLLNQEKKTVYENQPQLPTADARSGGRTPRNVLEPSTFENRPAASKADRIHDKIQR